jgi:hypothetical protein
VGSLPNRIRGAASAHGARQLGDNHLVKVREH